MCSIEYVYVGVLSICYDCLGENGEEIVARLKRDLLPTLISGIMYWPLCDFITFKFIPVHLQVCDEVFVFIAFCYYSLVLRA